MLRDGDNALVVAPQPSMVELIDLAFNQLRQYGRSDLAVCIRMLQAIERCARSSTADERTRLRHHAELLRDGLAPAFLPGDRAQFDATFAIVVAAL